MRILDLESYKVVIGDFEHVVISPQMVLLRSIMDDLDECLVKTLSGGVYNLLPRVGGCTKDICATFLCVS